MAGSIRLGGSRGGPGGGTTIRVETNAAKVAISLKEFNEALNYETVIASNEILEWIRKRATEYYMVPGSTDAKADPPNPTPGPLKKRTGRLARAVFIIKTKEKYGVIFEGRVEVNSNQAIYGWVHEYGGRLNQSAIKRMGRVFEFGKYRKNTHQTGGFNWMIKKRPFMAPAAADAEGYAKFRMDKVLVDARNHFESFR